MRINIKFLVTLEKNVIDIYKMFQHVYGRRTISKTQALHGMTKTNKKMLQMKIQSPSA